ncbi:FAD-binding oxidoreductase [Burkholderia thailandensis]|uniref:FAD-binding oxidoreductase n=1 Tax=Burkholderia thailandensis TaxID=57975 RepID=UPI00298F4194|nr:FAD-binding oxidoreductase [Burkholderia thailandensis]
MPRARGRHAARRDLGWPARAAQGQHRLRPARSLHRRRRHARHHHGRGHEAASASRREGHGARRARIAARGARFPVARAARGRPAADRLRADVGLLHEARRQALPATALPVRRRASADGAARIVGQRKRGARARALRKMMEEAFEAGLVVDAVVAENLAQSRAFWDLREHIPLAQADEGLNIKHDIAVPISSIARFIDETDAAIQAAAPGARMVTFGHLGDGNLHYNVQMPEGGDPKAFLAAHQAPINRIVYDNVHRHRGTISAEHGIGQLKIDDAQRYKAAVEIGLMRALKTALDPLNLMNPGKVLH